eukprot:48062-Eustigmatos_ZCMA.PRE.1
MCGVCSTEHQVCVECVGYLLEELRSPETLEQLRKDVDDADIFIGSLIFIQELAEKVRCSSAKDLIATSFGTSPWSCRLSPRTTH